MIVEAVVVGIALALCVAGWVPVVRNALRADHVLPGPSAVPVDRIEPEARPEAVSV